MSLVTYNGVCLPYPFHTTFRQEAVYDDVGQTDWHLTRYHLEIQCIVNHAYLGAMTSDPSLPLAAAPGPYDFMRDLRNRLMKPRQALSVKFNGVEYIPQNNMPGTVDAK